jgi:hypothetical protein
MIAAIALTGSALLGTPLALAQSDALIGPYQRYEYAKMRGDLAAASDFALQAVQSAENLYGASSLEYITALERLAGVLALNDQLDQSESYFALALAAREKMFGPDHPELVAVLESLADIHMRQQNYALAERDLRRVLFIERSVYGDKHPNPIATMERLRKLYVDTDQAAAVAAIDKEIKSATEISRSLGDILGDESRRYEADGGYATVRVFYGTDRARTGSEKAAQFYGIERGELDLGYLDVSIPKTHKYGALET